MASMYVLPSLVPVENEPNWRATLVLKLNSSRPYMSQI
ncbi:hypothetical protein BN2910_00670 [Achromobacter xylosoxidans]|nr:hypothetical protein BN2910_00670 [Achromobacter xylosoxidans]